MLLIDGITSWPTETPSARNSSASSRFSSTGRPMSSATSTYSRLSSTGSFSPSNNFWIALPLAYLSGTDACRREGGGPDDRRVRPQRAAEGSDHPCSTTGVRDRSVTTSRPSEGGGQRTCKCTKRVESTRSSRRIERISPAFPVGEFRAATPQTSAANSTNTNSPRNPLCQPTAFSGVRNILPRTTSENGTAKPTMELQRLAFPRRDVSFATTVSAR
jgi:hypothetical protein